MQLIVKCLCCYCGLYRLFTSNSFDIRILACFCCLWELFTFCYSRKVYTAVTGDQFSCFINEYFNIELVLYIMIFVILYTYKTIVMPDSNAVLLPHPWLYLTWYCVQSIILSDVGIFIYGVFYWSCLRM